MDFIPPYIFFARDYQYLTKSGLLELQLKQTLFLDHTAHRSTGSSKALLEELEHPKLKVECSVNLINHLMVLRMNRASYCFQMDSLLKALNCVSSKVCGSFDDANNMHNISPLALMG